MLGVHLCCEAALAAGVSRIVITGSGAVVPARQLDDRVQRVEGCGLPLRRDAEQRGSTSRCSSSAPGLVQTEMTSSFPDDAPWTPPELAPELVRKLATGSYDALAGRYLHAEHDDVDDLLTRIDEVRERDLNAIRLQR